MWRIGHCVIRTRRIFFNMEYRISGNEENYFVIYTIKRSQQRERICLKKNNNNDLSLRYDDSEPIQNLNMYVLTLKWNWI